MKFEFSLCSLFSIIWCDLKGFSFCSSFLSLRKEPVSPSFSEKEFKFSESGDRKLLSIGFPILKKINGVQTKKKSLLDSFSSDSLKFDLY